MQKKTCRSKIGKLKKCIPNIYKYKKSEKRLLNSSILQTQCPLKMLSMHFCLIQLPEIHINYNLEKKNYQEKNEKNCLKWKKVEIKRYKCWKKFLKGEVNGWAFCFQNNFLENWTGLCIYTHICMHVIKIAFGKWIPPIL